MNSSPFYAMENFAAVPLAQIPETPFEQFRAAVLEKAGQKNVTAAAFFVTSPEADQFPLYAVLGDRTTHRFLVARTRIGKQYKALTPDCHAFHYFEREIAEENGITPLGHPHLKPIRFEHSAEPGVMDYFTMQGDAVHEVAVGPVHAGVIEPGHFRFQCMGEDVYSLEIELGYQHRGIEKMLSGGPDKKSAHLIETAAGDTSVSAACVFDGICNALSGIPQELSPRALALRTIALELERIANHTGDLGALAGDVAFLTTSSYCGRIRGEFLNMTARLCGNRFGRSLIVPGGVRYDLTNEEIREFRDHFRRSRKDLEAALKLMFDHPSVLDRLENTGTVPESTARELGLVGVAARASHVCCDARLDFPYGAYPQFQDTVPLADSGDVFARALIRKCELAASCDIVEKLLETLPEGPVHATISPAGELQPDALAIGMVEAWRGELVHIAVTGKDGKFARYKIVDPSFHNWTGLAMALRGEQISNFPICNKSFNLSYCGHDL